MYSIGSSEAQSECKDCEVLSSLRLAGMSGTLKAVLCERQLLLERSTGHSLSLRYDQIVRMRHRQLPLIQPWLLITGVLLLFGAFRVLTGSVSYWTGAVGGSILLMWIIGRKPVLTIDTQNGDSHSLFGFDITLLKIRIIIERIQDGMSLKLAKEGLEELERKEPIYPTAGLVEVKNIVDSNIQKEVHDSAVANENSGTEQIFDAEIETENDKNLENEELIFNEHPAIERARRATQEIRNQRYQNEAHHGISQDDQRDSWWDNKPQPISQEPNFQLNNQESVYGAARYSPNEFDTLPSQEQNNNLDIDMGFDFSMFDDPSPAEPTMQFNNDPYPQTNTQSLNSNFGTQNEYSQTQRYNDNYSKENTFIPSFPSTEIDHSILPSKFVESLEEVQVEPRKEILNTEKSLSQNARRSEEEQRRFDLENSTLTNLNNTQRLKLGRDSTFRRLKVRKNGIQKISQVEVIRNLLVNSLQRITNVSKNILKKKGNSDNKEHSKTVDILRMQAKHSRQAEIAEAVRKLTKGNEELTDEDLEIIANTLEHGNTNQIEEGDSTEVPISFGVMKSTSKIKDEMDNLPGITRLE